MAQWQCHCMLDNDNSIYVPNEDFATKHYIHTIAYLLTKFGMVCTLMGRYSTHATIGFGMHWISLIHCAKIDWNVNPRLSTTLKKLKSAMVIKIIAIINLRFYINSVNLTGTMTAKEITWTKMINVRGNI